MRQNKLLVFIKEASVNEQCADGAAKCATHTDQKHRDYLIANRLGGVSTSQYLTSHHARQADDTDD